MKRFVEGKDRRQTTLLPNCVDDYVSEENPVRAIEAFVDALDLAALGFDGVLPEATGRPEHGQREDGRSAPPLYGSPPAYRPDYPPPEYREPGPWGAPYERRGYDRPDLGPRTGVAKTWGATPRAGLPA